ncbi:MAG: hypothetical protein K2Y20_13810 [Sphingomonas sp.]|nr:hypothetical protein [Sphingomonas sp.]
MKISKLDPAGPITGAELLPIVQGGNARRATMQAISARLAILLGEDFRGRPGGSNATFPSFESVALDTVDEGTDLFWAADTGQSYRYDPLLDPDDVDQLPPKKAIFDLAGRGFRSVYPGRTPIVIDARGGGLPDSTNVQQAINDAIGEKRPLTFKPGNRFCINLPLLFEPFDDGTTSTAYVNRQVTGYGATLTPSGSGLSHLLEIGRGFTPMKSMFAGIVFDAMDNTDIDYAVLLRRALHTTLFDLTFLCGNNNPTFDAIRLEQLVATGGTYEQAVADQDTGSFWTKILECTFRDPDGVRSLWRSCIHARGATNALRIRGGSMQRANIGVLMSTQETVTKSLPNGVRIGEVDFEGVSQTCVATVGLSGGYQSVGLVIEPCRIEQQPGTTFFSQTGSTVPSGMPPIIMQQAALPVGGSFTWKHNPNNLPITDWSTSNNPSGGTPDIYSPGGMAVRPDSDYAFQSRPAAGGGGYAVRGSDGALIADFTTNGTDAFLRGQSLGQQLHGTWMTTSTSGVRVRQSVTVLIWAGETSKPFNFPYFAEADNGYGVNIMLRSAYTGGTPYFSSPTTTGCTINMPGGFTGVMLVEIRR